MYLWEISDLHTVYSLALSLQKSYNKCMSRDVTTLVKSPTKRSVGRPPKYSSPEAMQEIMAAYFENCKQRDKPYTMCGLALALDISRMTLINYRNKSREFEYVVKRARLFVERSNEELLFVGSKGQIKGAIFTLKANFGWRG